ncbi:MAG: DEAD/DEAH box helicase family protein [Erysipelotrichaceae bacterium]|nr:DEAD/DEAH box helicase family protein [Erysipelotrichaceae bacterium]
MNLESYDLDSLRRLVRRLIEENNNLKKQLSEADIPFESEDFFNNISEYDDYDEDQAGRIYEKQISEQLANHFYAMFWGRTDVYAKRSKSGNYYPQCENRWNECCPIVKGESKFCEPDCSCRKWRVLKPWVIVKHLKGENEDGSDVIGTYPLLPDGTCRFIVFDFDNHEKGSEREDFANRDNEFKDEVNALRKICENNGITPLVERSRSGKGAHLWIFFDKPISAKLARNFGFLLLDKGMMSVNLHSFHYYDRMYPSQDVSNGIGNLIALPLQGDALRKGNSAFVDENWNAYPDQWDVLFNRTRKLTKDEILDHMVKWQAELSEEKGLLTDFSLSDRPKPWRRNEKLSRDDVTGKLHIVLSDGLYVDTLNLMPMIQNQIRSLAAFDNPLFYKHKAMGYSNYYTFSSVYLGKDIDGYIRLPRGLKDKLLEEINKAKIDYDIEDHREKGRPIRVDFKGDLRAKQDLAAENMFTKENGILNAATGFGKTVIASNLISRHKVSTLIILQKTSLIEQWEKELNDFLNIREKLPEYETKSGKKKERESVIGILQGNKDTMSGIIDIAMVGSLYRKGKFHELINSYGMIIVDECQHSASNTFVEVLKKVNAKYVYGLSANLKRSDDLDKITTMMIGPVLHRYTAMERAMDNGIAHYIVPRFTRTVDFEQDRKDINKAYNLVCYHSDRNGQIIDDIKQNVISGRTPLVLTRYKEHARYLYENLSDSADHVFLVYGDNSTKENKEIISKLKQIPEQESLILIATGQMIGEGFDFPRLDVLFIASPVSHEGLLEQYVGRIDRIYEGKTAVYVYDYVDSHITVFNNMYKKRLKTYKKIGFKVKENDQSEKQSVNAIYDPTNYVEIFENDLIEANKSIIISSPSLTVDKVERLLQIIKSKQEEGLNITIITNDPDHNLFSDSDNNIILELISKMRKSGINVVLNDDTDQCFAIVDDEIVWYGGINLLGKEDIRDNLIRIKDERIAAELLENTI